MNSWVSSPHSGVDDHQSTESDLSDPSLINNKTPPEMIWVDSLYTRNAPIGVCPKRGNDIALVRELRQAWATAQGADRDTYDTESEMYA